MTTTVTIHQEDLGDGVMLYHVRMSGQIIWSGLGSCPVRTLLRTLTEIEKRQDRDPDATAGVAVEWSRP